MLSEGMAKAKALLKAPVYARTFTAALAKLKLEEAGLATDVLRVVRARPETVEAGPFRVQFLPVSHSIPESAALIIDTRDWSIPLTTIRRGAFS